MSPVADRSSIADRFSSSDISSAAAGQARRRRSLAPLASATAALLVAALVVAGTRSIRPPLRQGEARLVPSGTVEVALSGEGYAAVRSPLVIHAGDRVRVTDGGAALELEDGTAAELRTGSIVRINATPRPPLSLEQGDLLVEAGTSAVVVDAGSTQATVETGTAKLVRGRSLLAGVYSGSVTLDTLSGERLVVPRLRQATVIGGGLIPEEVEPLTLRIADEWDVRILNHVIVLSRQLDSLGRGFEAQLDPGAIAGPELFSDLVPGLAGRSIAAGLLADRPAGESLIGLTVAVLSTGVLGDSELARNAEGVFDLRRAGGSWGLVVADRDLASATVLKVLAEAVGRAAPKPTGPLQAHVTTPSTPARGSGASAAQSRREVATGPSGGSRTSPGTTSQPKSGPQVVGPSAPAVEPHAPPSALSTPPSGSTSPPSGGAPPDQGAAGEAKVLDVGPTGIGLDPVIDTVEDVLDGLLDNLLGVIRL